jgi:Trypsin-like peptidase domain
MRVPFFKICAILSVATFSTSALSQENPDDAVRETLRALDQVQEVEKTLDASADKSGAAKIQAQIGKLQQILMNLKAIYGNDNRLNFYDASTRQQNAGRSTFILVRDSKIEENEDGTLSLAKEPVGLCTPAQIDELNARGISDYPKERFFDEAAPGFCSGFKVGDDLIATAGHCVRDNVACADIRFVHQFWLGSRQARPDENVAKSAVFSCKEIVAREYAAGGPDWAIVRTDRPLNNIPTVQLRNDRSLREKEGLIVMGYPMGLPLKIAGDATVRQLDKGYFVANLDTYGGNSGSLVVNAGMLAKGVVMAEGILVRGEEDFELTSPCLVSKRCRQDGCRGEDVTYAAEFSQYVK